jgi:hypothetical protein
LYSLILLVFLLLLLFRQSNQNERSFGTMILFSSFLQFKLILALLMQVVLVCSYTNTTNFAFISTTGAMQSWTVPFNVHSIHVVVEGANAGDGVSHGTPGQGAIVECDLAVSGNTVIYISVGGKGVDGGGSNSNVDRNGGFNGGGKGWGAGSGGGGASDIRIGGTAFSDRKVVAGGGGGIYGAGNCGGNPQPNGGNGGQPLGTAGTNRCTGGAGAVGGGGGTASGGGTAAVALGASVGVLGVGGRGDHNTDDDSPGGGGGLYGGK